MKIKVLGLIFVLILWVFLNFRGEAPVQESALAQSVPKTRPQNTETPKLKKIETHAPNKEVEVKEKPQITDSVPWDDLSNKWNEELKDFIKGIDSQNGEKMFKEYLQSKKDFEKQIKIISEQLAKTYQYDEEKDDITFIDKKKYDKLNDQINDEHLILTRKTKKIFGKHYSQVNEYYKGFKQSIQAYYSGEGEIAIDPAFGSLED